MTKNHGGLFSLFSGLFVLLLVVLWLVGSRPVPALLLEAVLIIGFAAAPAMLWWLLGVVGWAGALLLAPAANVIRAEFLGDTSPSATYRLTRRYWQAILHAFERAAPLVISCVYAFGAQQLSPWVGLLACFMAYVALLSWVFASRQGSAA